MNFPFAYLTCALAWRIILTKRDGLKVTLATHTLLGPKGQDIDEATARGSHELVEERDTAAADANALRGIEWDDKVDPKDGSSEEFHKESFLTFGRGDDAPRIDVCPWYHFAEAGDHHVIMPRGASTVAVPCRSKAIAQSTRSFQNGKDFFILKGGTLLNAFVGGAHNMGNDYDLDTTNVEVTAATGNGSLLQTAPNRHGPKMSTKTLHLSTVKIAIGSTCMSSGGYGTETIASTGQETTAFISQKLCLCKADGVKGICSKDRSGLAEYGESYVLPLPGSKNLGSERMVDTYIGRDAYSGWRDESIEDLKSYDPDNNGQITLAEVLGVVTKKGVNEEWLESVKKDDPCVFVNAQRQADYALRLLKHVKKDKDAVMKEVEKFGKVNYDDNDWVQKTSNYFKDKLKFKTLNSLSDKGVCGDEWEAALAH